MAERTLLYDSAQGQNFTLGSRKSHPVNVSDMSLQSGHQSPSSSELGQNSKIRFPDGILQLGQLLTGTSPLTLSFSCSLSKEIQSKYRS